MTVRYITVTPVTNLFKPATRAFGDIAIVGVADNDATGPMKAPVPITNPDSITFSSKTTLTASVATAATTVDVAGHFGFPSATPFKIRIGDEIMNVTALTATSFTVTRAEDGTTASTHDIGDQVTYTSKEKRVTDADWFKGALGKSVRKCFEQKPGPTTVYAVRTDPAEGANALSNALAEVGKLDVQIVALANT